VLAAVLLRETPLRGEDLLVIRLQFRAQRMQRRGQVALAQHGGERQRQQAGDEQGKHPFLFHSIS